MSTSQDGTDAGPAGSGGGMSGRAFDQAVIREALLQAAVEGWEKVSVLQAAQAAGLSVARARARFPFRGALLMRLGLIADEAALDGVQAAPALPRDALFDLLMRRFDVLQAHRDGVLALLRALPMRPGATALLGLATLRSMGWMLEAAGLSSGGIRGRLRAQGLVGVWLYALRAWQRDESADLAGTMAALDRALDRAARAARFLDGRGGGEPDASSPPPFPDLPDMPPPADPAPPMPPPMPPSAPEPVPTSPDLLAPGPVPAPPSV